MFTKSAFSLIINSDGGDEEMKWVKMTRLMMSCVRKDIDPRWKILFEVLFVHFYHCMRFRLFLFPEMIWKNNDCAFTNCQYLYC